MSADIRSDEVSGKAPEGSEVQPGAGRDTAASPAIRNTRTGFDLVVLNGRQSGARTRLRHGRYLIGNRDKECDLVVDLGAGDRISCLLRCEGQRMQIMLLEGEGWLEQTYLPAHEMMDLEPMKVVTLGRVSLVACPSEQDDVSQVCIPDTLTRPDAEKGAQPVVPLMARQQGRVRRIRQLRWATFAALLVVVGVTLYTASLTWMSDAQEGMKLLDAERQAMDRIVADLGLRELRTEVDAQQRQLIIAGYVMDHDDLRALEIALEGARRAPFVRVEVIAPIKQALNDGLRGIALARPVSYLGSGGFSFGIESGQLKQTVAAMRGVLRTQPGLDSIDLKLHDVISASTGQVVSYRLLRAGGRNGELEVVGDPLPAAASIASKPLFMDVRHGRIPSVVTRDGARLFEGALLPDGSVIRRIGKDHVVVARGDVERSEPLSRETDVAGRSAEAGQRATPGTDFVKFSLFGRPASMVNEAN